MIKNEITLNITIFPHCMKASLHCTALYVTYANFTFHL